jgi:hypothetical protein
VDFGLEGIPIPLVEMQASFLVKIPCLMGNSWHLQDAEPIIVASISDGLAAPTSLILRYSHSRQI